MNSLCAICQLALLLCALVQTGLADEPAGSDDLASEFNGVKLIRLVPSQGVGGYRCRLFTDAEHKKMQEEYRTSTKAPGNRALFGTYLILEVKKDRLILLPEVWTETRKIRVISLQYISEVERTGVYAELPK